MASSKQRVVLDIKTLQILQTSASKNYNAAQKIFDKTDDTDSMHEAEQWSNVVIWLEKYIKAVK